MERSEIISKAGMLANSYINGNRTYVVDSLISKDLYSREEALALVVAMVISMPPDKADFLYDQLNQRQVGTTYDDL